jgi:hypothetical protein
VHTDRNAQNIQGQTHCCIVQNGETCLQDSFSFLRHGDPKHGNQPDIHNNNKATREEQNMPQSVRNPRTGCKCKQPPKYTTYCCCAQALCIGNHHFLCMVYARQSRALLAILDATILLTAVLACFAIEVHIAGGPTPGSDALVAVGVSGIALFFCQHHLDYGALQIVEESLADMTPEEENAPTYRRDWRYRRIQDFIDNSKVKNLTNYKKSELVQLLRYSDLPEWIVVPVTDDGEHCYKLSQEELLLYMLIMMKSGSTHVFMDITVTQGNNWDWMYGYKWIVNYLDEKKLQPSWSMRTRIVYESVS